MTVEIPLRLEGIDPDRAYSAREIKELREAGAERSESGKPVIRKIYRLDAEEPAPLEGRFEAEVDGEIRVVEYHPDIELRDTEQVPLLEEGGVEGFIGREVLPYAPGAWIVSDSIKVGYEVSFTHHFYKPVELRSLDEIRADIAAVERETEGLLAEIVGSGEARA